MSRHLNLLASDPYQKDGRWEGPAGSILVEIKKTHSVRDVRDVFLALAYLLGEAPAGSSAVCVLVDSRFSHRRLEAELNRFRTVIHPALANRIHFLIDKGDARQNIVAFSGSLKDAPAEFCQWLEELVRNKRPNRVAHQLPPRQLVVAALAQLRRKNQSPVTVKHLQETCQVSYPTVAAVLKVLSEKGMLEVSGERGVRLRQLTTREWMELAGEHAQQRKGHFFTDPTGQASPEQMAKRLARLQKTKQIPRSVRIGGVIGASRYFPELDITSPPRLDLSVEADPAGIAAMLDAGLIPKSKPEQRVVLAVHLTRNPCAITSPAPESNERWAGELECLSDLIEMGFTREATEMAHHMEVTGNEVRREA